jgi:lantibiotic modifying enzyme
VREVVADAFGWIEAAAVPAEGGSCWTEGGVRYDDLYCGTAGVLLACAEAASARPSAEAGSALGRVAAAARGRLLHLAAGDPAALPDDGLFGGWGGAAVALRAWGAAAADPEAAEAAERLTGAIAGRVLRRTPEPDRCTDIIDGDAGIILALLGAPGGVEPRQAEAAGRLADGLVALADERDEGPQWLMGRGYERLMPGFSHGTAGIAYALAVTGRALGRDDLVALAVRAADGLMRMAGFPGRWALPLVVPPQEHRPPVTFGWCHGPTGTARLFTLLDAVAPQPRWGEAVEACLGALRDSRLPERLYPGYWDNVARCCGTAGVGQFLLDRHAATGDPALLDWAKVLAADVLSRTVTEPAGVTWSNTEHTKHPPQLPPEPGFMQGSAGVASWLARLAAPGTPPLLPWL